MTTSAVDSPRTAQASIEANAYQTFLHVVGEEPIRQAREQLDTWLREKKGWTAPTGVTGLHRDGRRELLVLRPETADGSTYRARLTEHLTAGTWRTTLTAHSTSAADTWIALRVSSSEGRFASVPRLADHLLDVLQARDGTTWLTREPRQVGEEDAEALTEEITAVAGRHGIYFVAGTSAGTDYPAFVGQVTRATREVRGLAQVAVLDAAATTVFNEVMGSTHAVPPGAMRTYLPEVDPAVDDDGLRHRVLSPRRLVEAVDEVRPMLGRVARRHAGTRPSPVELVRIDAWLARLEDELVLRETRADVTSALTHQREASTLQAEILDRARQQLEAKQERIEQLEDQVRVLQALYEDEQVDLAVSEEGAARLRDDNRWLRRQLVEMAGPESGLETVPPAARTDYPGDYADLVERCLTLKDDGVVFTGHPKDLRAVEEVDPLQKILRTTWDIFLVLSDYVRARHEGRCTTGLRGYLENPPNGFRAVAPKKFAESESATTMQRWGDQRLFPVPVSVDISGEARMRAHFRLGRSGMASPRMYVLDRWTSDGHVYVGYVGTHLRNTQTN